MNFDTLLHDIRAIAKAARAAVGRSLDRTLTLRNWLIGAYIVEYEQSGEDRAAYGKQVSDRIINTLSDADKDIRAGAAWIMGELKDNRAVEALEKVAKDDYPLARVQAKASLLAMGKGKKKQEEKENPEEPEETKSE